jgi:hypothetical protein
VVFGDDTRRTYHAVGSSGKIGIKAMYGDRPIGLFIMEEFPSVAE